MLTLPVECIINILSFTGSDDCVDAPDGIYPQLRASRQLYCTSKELVWLKDLYYMVIQDDGGHRMNYETLTLSSEGNGPHYSKWYDATLYEFAHYSKGESIGDRVYEDAGSGSPVTTKVMVNGTYHKMTYDKLDTLLKQVYDQWEGVDPEAKKWVENGDRPMLVRRKVPDNAYKITL